MTMPLLATSTDLTKYKDGDVDQALEVATSLIRKHCGWHIAPSITATVTVDPTHHPILMLPTTHLTAVATVTELGELVPAEDYDWSELGHLTRLCGRWGWRPRSVMVTMTHGYAEVPPEVMSVALGIATRMETPAGTVRAQGAGVYNVQMATNPDGSVGGLSLNFEERAVLTRYRLEGIA
ncbi:hypothetical protein ACFWPK_04330 [Nocardia sp. NPDC058519]|uniref:hypothetical protein n=1 Tax=Nocardia sp. NPDC058519 TaxID=3346535 RepID=UPI0036546545